MAKKIAIPSEVEFDFIKSNFFRVIKADGAFGGVAPNGAIHMQIFSERQPIPTKVTHSINDGQIGPEIIGKRQSRKAFVREVEIDVVLDLSQAIAVRDWLNDKISQVEKLAQQSMVPKILARLPIVNKSNRKINERSGKNVVRRNINK